MGKQSPKTHQKHTPVPPSQISYSRKTGIGRLEASGEVFFMVCGESGPGSNASMSSFCRLSKRSERHRRIVKVDKVSRQSGEGYGQQLLATAKVVCTYYKSSMAPHAGQRSVAGPAALRLRRKTGSDPGHLCHASPCIAMHHLIEDVPTGASESLAGPRRCRSDPPHLVKFVAA